MKKIFSVLLSIVLVLSMSTVAFAEGTGTITITNAENSADYDIYKMLDFTPSKTNANKGVYTIVDGWKDFFTTSPATDYFNVTTVDSKEVVVLKDGVDKVDEELAGAAIAYAKNKSIAVTSTAKASSETVTFTGLDFGYYAIDSSLGIICALTNTNSTLTATEKNGKPDIDKFVQEDSRETSAELNYGWGKVNDADIDQKVNFKSTITVGLGAVNYEMHDTMEEGLTFNNDVTVKLADGTAVDAKNYTVEFPAVDADEEKHTFDVKFDNEFIKTLAQGSQFTVYYSATLNENANIVDDGNDNTVYLSYGEKNEWKTTEHKTTTYTWKIDVLKFTMDGENKVNLAGAVFQLLDKDNKEIKFSQVLGAAVPTYKVDAEGTITDITTDSNGKFEFVGLDEGTYKLHEVSAPEGYNKLTTDMEVVITSEYKEATLTATYKINGKAPATIEVENKAGGLFPETGGMGTTIFYTVGAVLMIAAVGIFVSKKRMATFS
ncbi:MAG: isopeptide-forming domain-containing fimbrial protein [Ruminococcus sp.]|nr:isopeptide-forming domain-containing fimbrial protein [Ruminococcus sp.]